jgi:hypothetical protein
MEKTPLYVKTSGNPSDAVLYTVAAVQDFGKEVLDRDFQVTPWARELPLSEAFVKDKKLMVDSYRQAFWDLYHANKERPIFSLEMVEEPLIADYSNKGVKASSVQYLDLNTGELIRPDKAGVVVSNVNFNHENPDYNRAFAYFLAAHEMGHLVIGEKSCLSDSCVFSHNYGALPKILDNILTRGKLPVCDRDKQRIREFKKLWGIR